MYYSNRRESERIHFRGTGRSGSTMINIAYSTPCVLESVYSWRTGRNLVSDPPVSPPTYTHDGFGIKTPTGKGSLVDRLTERKRYLEEFQRAAFPAETQSGSVSTNRTSSTDSGHLFMTHKSFRMPYSAHLDYYQGSSVNYSGDIWWGLPGALFNPSPHPSGFPGEVTTNALGITEANRQGVANRFFANTAPDVNGATLMTTLIELLRGDVPSMLKNFHSMMSGLKSVKNQLGSDYLNIAFGWTPLIQEYANVIRVGMQLERVIYYESFRRQRRWSGPSGGGTIAPTTGLENRGTVWFNSTLPELGDKLGPSTGISRGFAQDARWVASEDYNFTSKYTGIAKASRRANDFSDQAFDVFKRLGLVDDPRMLWDLTPYSWLVDWFTSMGESISNANVYSPTRGKYNIDYAYFTTKYTYSSQGSLTRPTGTYLYDRSLRVTRGTAVSTSVTKWRTRATPFGFGTQLGSLSASQYAILVALGLARLR